jgi:hypothetical protein
MRWFRSNKRLGAWCALFALMTQFAISFVHVHPEDFGSQPALAFSAPLALQASDTLPDEPAMPAKLPSGFAGVYALFAP